MHPFPYKIIDLTHTLDENTPSWSGECGFQYVTKDYQKDTHSVSFRAQQVSMNAGIGTHMDAPAHCIPGGLTIEALSLEDLIAPCVVIDISEKANTHYRLSVDDIHLFEKTYRKIPPHSFVIIRTGWEQHWHKPDHYRNNYQFPSISQEAATFLLTRDINGLGIDTLSPDTPESGFPVHASVLGAGKYIVENVANSGMLPPIGSFSLALPIKAKGGVEAVMRLIGLIKN